MDYLNTNTEFNESTFDKEEFFDAVQEVLYSNKIPADDVKANVYAEENHAMADWDEDEFDVHCHMSFILYECDVPKKKFKALAERIEKLYTEQFSLNYNDVECHRYDDSEYSSDGYDVEVEFRVAYKLKQ